MGLTEVFERISPRLDQLRAVAVDPAVPITERVHAEIERMRLLDQAYQQELGPKHVVPTWDARRDGRTA